jgi:cell division protein FtsZ
LGGGTGTGASSTIAKACKSRGILTVGVVTKPFEFEGKYRNKICEKGLEELEPNVDTLLVIPNQKLLELYPKKTKLLEAFNIVDTVLFNSIKSVSDLMLTPGLINLDFSDISSVMKGMGRATMGMGESSDPVNRAIKAAELAIHNPLLDSSDLKNAKGIIINISGGNDLTLMEIQLAAERIRKEVDEETNIIFGSSIEDSLDGKVRISIIATGLGINEKI